MAVTLGSVTTAALNQGVNTTFSFVSTDQPLYVRYGRWRNGATITGITYGGTALTKVAETTPSNGDDDAAIWRLLTPVAGTANIVVSHGSATAGSVIVANSVGQDSGAPEGTAVVADSTVNGTGTGNQSVSAVTGDLTIVVIANGAGAAITPAATGGTPSEESDAASNGEQTETFKVDGAATEVSGSWSGSTGWAIATIPLKQAAVPLTPATAALVLTSFAPNINPGSNTPRLNAKMTHFWGGR